MEDIFRFSVFSLNSYCVLHGAGASSSSTGDSDSVMNSSLAKSNLGYFGFPDPRWNFFVNSNCKSRSGILLSGEGSSSRVAETLEALQGHIGQVPNCDNGLAEKQLCVNKGN